MKFIKFTNEIKIIVNAIPLIIFLLAFGILKWFDFLNARGIIVVGDANYVIERFHRCRESYGLDHVVCMQQFVNVPYHKIIASLDRFIEHVVPCFGTKSIGQLRNKKNA